MSPSASIVRGEVRSTDAVVAVHAARDAGDVDLLLEMLTGTDLMGRRSAALALGDLGTRQAVGPLVRCLAAKDEPLRIGALKALASIGDSTAINAVFETAVDDASFGVRAQAAQTLVSLGDPRAVDVLGSMLLEANGRYATSYPKWAAKLFVEIGDPRAIRMLEDAARRAGPLTKFRLRRAIRRLKAANSLRAA
jgi:HEAT repeat protein